MSEKRRWVIVGAGAAGLSLATELARQKPPQVEVLVLDSKERFTDDRTWCFFSVADHPFRHCVTHRWQRWVVQGKHRVERHSKEVAYEYLPASAFYKEAQRLLEQGGNAELQLGTPVSELQEHPDHVEVVTPGKRFRADLVFDSRPHWHSERRKAEQLKPRGNEGRPPAFGAINWLQHFRGWFVRTRSPRFDPRQAMLMDFRVGSGAQRNGIHFMYVLPFSDTEALIEDTYFSPNAHDADLYEANLRAYLKRLGIFDYELLREEQGQIPMSTAPFPARLGPRVLRIGVTGGLARPSTGYAFTAIQRHSRALAEATVRAAETAKIPIPPPRPRRTLWLDQVFLSYLAANPDKGPELFCQLFQRTKPETLARFLSEVSTPWEDLRVMRSLSGHRLAPLAGRTAVHQGLKFVHGQTAGRLRELP